MKTIILFLVIFATPYMLKADYTVDFSNPATYQTTCGTVQPSQWSVSGTTCELLLPPLLVNTDSSRKIDYLIRINQSGNLYKSDYLTVYYKNRKNGSWISDTTIIGQLNNNVRDISGSFTLYKGDTLYFKIVAYTRFTSGFWAVKSGDIAVTGVTPVLFPLPVELVEFDGQYNETSQSNLITWATATETNNARFVIERSSDGVIYELIETIPGAGNSNTLLRYNFEDYGINGDYYYRLTQFDFDGKSETFKPLFIQRYDDNSSSSLIEQVWYQNNNVHFTLNTLAGADITISLLDMSGGVIHLSQIQPETSKTKTSVRYDGNKGVMLLLVVTDSNGKRDTRKLITM